MESFIENHPTSTKRNLAYFEVAQYYFAEANYLQSLKWYENIYEPELAVSDMEKANFQRGYANFSIKKNKDAANYLNKVIQSTEYGNQAKYYLGYLAYEGDNYKVANELFGQVENQDKYKEKMGYFQADMNFKLGNFQKAIDLGITSVMYDGSHLGLKENISNCQQLINYAKNKNISFEAEIGQIAGVED
jgi:tetratricopeptide (TPR) repeat protein